MNRKKRGKEVDIMAAIKPIQTTPELSGKDAAKLLNEANAVPSEDAVKKVNMLHNVLTNIRKA